MGILSTFGSLFGFGLNFNHFGTNVFSGEEYRTYSRVEMLKLVLTNPAFLKVMALQCDTFSMGKFYSYDKKGKEVEGSRFIEMLNDGRIKKSQFLFDYMFWNMIGNVWIGAKDLTFEQFTSVHILNPLWLELPPVLQYRKILFSKEAVQERGKINVPYRNSAQTIDFKFNELLHFTDLSNTMTESVEGWSRLDALYKIVINSEGALMANKINTDFARKFLVSGTVDAMDTSKRMLGKDEKDDIEKKILGPKSVHAVKSMIEIKRFVEDMKKLELNKGYLEDYFLIGNMYNIPRDVLEAFNSSTYENQEKARASHVYYTLEPKGEDLCQGLKSFLGEENDLVLSFDHLPFVQVMEIEREKARTQKITNLEKLLSIGVDQKEALNYLDLDFKPFEYERRSTNESPGNSQEDEEQTA